MVVTRRIVTLLTDFGLKDAYVASMKAVLLSINPELTIVDVSHDLPKFDVRHAAVVLAQAARFFPRETVHMAIVDPGVGTRRKPLVVKTKRFFFVGPDNGVLSIAALRDGVVHVFRVDEGRYVLPQRSSTFAGRDIFAPVAAHITCGVPLEKLGKETASFTKLLIDEAESSGSRISGEVLIIDSFGNIVTNIDGSLLKGMKRGETIVARIGERILRVPFLRTYGDADRGQPLALISSSGLLEIGLNQGNMSERLRGVKEGTRVQVQL